MPIKKAAAKALKQSRKKAAVNKVKKDEIAFILKKFRKALEANKLDEAKDWLKKAVKGLDKAAQKRIIKKNTAARKKSRLNKSLNKAAKK